MCSEPAAAARRTTLQGATMGTRWSATVEADAALDLAALQRELAAAVAQVDAQMSPWQPDSALMRLNRAAVDAWVELPAELLEVLAAALEIHRLSAGAFNPCVGELVNAWGFGAVRDAPDPQAIRAARGATPADAAAGLQLDAGAGRARKRLPLALDLCGIAKGYAVDRMTDVLRAHGVRHALAALDGELRALGPRAGGAPWSVALERPDVTRRATLGVIELQDLAVATSGDYRHYVDVGATRLAHTMDAARGAPVNNGVASVTVLSARCMHADAWATALLVAGPERGLALAQREGLDVLFLLRRGDALTELGLGRFGTASAGALSAAGPARTR